MRDDGPCLVEGSVTVCVESRQERKREDRKKREMTTGTRREKAKG